MAEISLKSFEVPGQTGDPLTEQRESGVTHTPYETEQALFGCIENGDKSGLAQMMDEFLHRNIVAGRMSGNGLRQMQYLAVCFITLATRAAIRGGVDEMTAYNLSDKYIQAVDRINDIEKIPGFLSEKALEITELVRESSYRRDYPAIIKKCIYYIDTHLYQKITAAALGKYCGLSEDYLAAQFKKHTGLTVGRYVRKAKLRESRRLLDKGVKNPEIVYLLGFCSESYFISCYKKEYGATPGRRKSESGPVIFYPDGQHN